MSGSDTSPQRGIGKGEEAQSVREGKAELRVRNLQEKSEHEPQDTGEVHSI